MSIVLKIKYGVSKMIGKAIFKFNGGASALLCSKCSVIIKTGKDFTENEWKSFRGELKLESQFCNKCKAEIRDQKIIEILQ